MKNIELDSDLCSYFDNSQYECENMDLVESNINDLINTPSFVADVLKDNFIHHILEALEDEKITQSDLAKRCGKSRQYLNKILKDSKNKNYTLHTIVEIMHALNRNVEIHYPKKNEYSIVLRCVRNAFSSEWGALDDKRSVCSKEFYPQTPRITNFEKFDYEPTTAA